MAEAMVPTQVDAQPAAARQTLAPEELAPYFPQLEILECLGRGGMGVVYKARQKTLNRFVALKLLAPERVRDTQFAERFTREAQALAALNHPNIVTVYDFGQAGGFYFLLMEFVDGVNLRQLLRARKFTPEEALAIVPPLCDALQLAHDRGIVHRDIKPENLLLDKAGRVKVADFGIAKMLGTVNAGGDAGEPAAPGNTTQTAVGTPGYSAPEQKTDPQRVDNRADIYSLGVVFYEMLTGELPRKPIEPPSRKVQIDVRLDAVVLRALQQNPELRFQQVSEVKTMVETIVGDAGLPPAEPAARPVSPGKSLSTPSSNTTRTQHFMKKNMVVGLLIIIGIALVFVPALLYWRMVFPWHHVISLDYYYQTRIASASPHDRDPGNNLARLPAGHQVFDGVRFNVAGIISLACGNDVTRTNDSYPYPVSVEGIPVNRFCSQLHLLHGTAGGADDQTLVAKLVLHYADGTTADLDIIYGQQVYDWWFKGDDNPPLAGNTKIAWIGDNPTAKKHGYRIRVFKTSFMNPKPGVRVETVDYVSALASTSSPFLLALTEETVTDSQNVASKVIPNPEVWKEASQSSTVTPPAGPVELKWKWPPVGERVVFDMETKRNGEYLTPGQPDPQKEYKTVEKKLGLTVLKATPEGGHEVELEFLSIRDRINLGGETVLDYDSTQKSSAPGTNSLTDIYGKVVGSKIRYFLNTSNEVERMEGVDELEKRLSSGASADAAFSKAQFSEGNLKQMMTGLYRILPTKAVQPGDTWSHQMGIAMNPIGTVSMDYTVTFQSWEQHWKRNCARLEFQSIVKTKPDPNSNPAGTSVSSLEGTISGVAWFDPELGMIIETAGNTDMKMVINRPINPSENPGASGPTQSTIYQWHDVANATVLQNYVLEGLIGVELRVDRENIIIQEIVPGLPAAAQKDIHVGDRIIAVAQDTGPAVLVHGGQLAQAVALIHGPAGTTVRLTLVSSGEDDSHARVVSLVRAELKAPPR
jgi:serine/threonine protein kinase